MGRFLHSSRSFFHSELGPTLHAATTAGSSTAYTATLTPAPAALETGLLIALKFDETNGANPTLNVNSLGAKKIFVDGVAPSATALITTKTYLGIYDAAGDSNNGVWDFR